MRFALLLLFASTTMRPYASMHDPAIRVQRAAQVDPYASSIVLDLTFAGVDGATSITDRSPNPKVMTAVGNAQVDTAQFKWGGSSYLGDGTDDRFTTPDGPDFTLGSGDFTVEIWARFASTSGFPTMYGQIIDPGGLSDMSVFLGYNATDKISFAYSVTDGVTYSRLSSTTVPTIGQWYHIAASRNGGTIRLFIDGVEVDSEAIAGSVWDSSSLVRIGNAHSGCGSCDFNGHLDGLRVTKGVGRYTAAFTPVEYLPHE